MLIIFTGNGKGKTTAALGQALRAVGDGRRVLVIQFIKGPWKSGEDEAVKRLSPDMKIKKMGKGFVGILGDKLPLETHKKAAESAIAYARRAALARAADVIILDEVWNSLHLKLISEKALREAIALIEPRVKTLILTGRDCPQNFIDMADIATEMKELRFVKEKARKGVEY